MKDTNADFYAQALFGKKRHMLSAPETRAFERFQREGKKLRHWTKMVIKDGAPPHLSPATIPVKTAVSKIVRSTQISYADTIDGDVTVALLPDASVSFLQSTQNTLPIAVADATVANPLALPLECKKGQPAPTSGLLFVTTADGVKHGSTSWSDGGQLDVGYTGFYGVGITLTAPSTVRYQAQPRFSCFMRPFYGSGGVVTMSAAEYFPAHKFQGGSIPAPANANFFGLALSDSNGNLITYGVDSHLDVSVHVDQAVFGGLPGFQNHTAIKSELLNELSGITHIRCTAWNMLCKYTGSLINAAGTIWGGMVPINLINEGSTSKVATALSRQNEKNRVGLQALKDGMYGFGLHDDVESNEPSGPGEFRSGNALIFAIQMANNDAAVEITTEQVFEYYTAAQVIVKKTGFGWDHSSKAIYAYLRRQQMIMDNPFHPAAIAAIAKGAYDIYSRNADWIDPLAGKAIGFVADKVLPKKKKKKANNNNNNNKKKKAVPT